MAHELEITNGRASMFYVGDPPWHGLGVELKKPATAREAIVAARLDWTVEKKALVATDGSLTVGVPDRFGIVRADQWGEPGCPVLGIVGKDYAPLQNAEAFQFFDPIVGQGAAIYHTAGVLGQGERVWILAKLPEDIRVAGDDITEKYLLLSNSHDGTSSMQVKFTPIRVVCQNTLTMALKQGPTLRVAHKKDLRERLRDAERNLGIIRRQFGEIEEVFKCMVNVKMDGNRLETYLAMVFPDPSDPDDLRAKQRVKQDRIWTEYFFDEGKGNSAPDVKGTLWAAYNGVAELVDHRKTKQPSDKRLNSVWFGDGYLIKARALRVAQTHLSSWAN